MNPCHNRVARPAKFGFGLQGECFAQNLIKFRGVGQLGKIFTENQERAFWQLIYWSIREPRPRRTNWRKIGATTGGARAPPELPPGGANLSAITQAAPRFVPGALGVYWGVA